MLTMIINHHVNKAPKKQSQYEYFVVVNDILFS